MKNEKGNDRFIGNQETIINRIYPVKFCNKINKNFVL